MFPFMTFETSERLLGSSMEPERTVHAANVHTDAACRTGAKPDGKLVSSWQIFSCHLHTTADAF
jgi:hypothetical protein